MAENTHTPEEQKGKLEQNDQEPTIPNNADQENTQSDDGSEEPKYFTVKIFAPNGNEISVQTSLGDTVQDLKQMLFEAHEVCFVTSYALQYNGEDVNDFAELSGFPDLKEGSSFQMVEIPYTQFCSRLHIRRVRDLVSNVSEKPASLLSDLTTQLEKELTVPKKQETPTNKPKPNNNTGKGKGKKKNNKKKGKKYQQKNMKQEKEIQTKEKSESLLVKEFDFAGDLGKFFPKSTKSNLQCIGSISYSGWNPPPGNRSCKGDLAYLVVRTLENKTFHITSSTRGFFVNSSTSSTFNPVQLEGESSNVSHTLVELLEKLSGLFKSNFQKILEDYFSKHPYEVIPVPIEDASEPWIDSGEPYAFDLNRAQSFLSGEDLLRYPDQLRDWNAEYQSCRELPSETIQERIFRDRSIVKVTNEFTNAAIAGAKAIVQGTVQAINPTDPLPAHLYIYNNIFFSHALNGRFLFDEEEGDMGPYKLVGNDLEGVKTYNQLNIKDLHTVLTVLVNFHGYRIVAQSIIPGILHQTGSDCIKYGSIDHGKTLTWSEDFHKLVQEIGKALRIPEHEIEDEEGNRVKLCCPSETKGVLGTDGRKYVLDLDRTTVRDSNFSFHWATVRPELYEVYIEYLAKTHILEHASRIQKQQQEEEKEDNKKEEAETSSKTSLQDKIPPFEPPMFNPNAYDLKHGKLIGSEEELEKTKKQILELGDFINTHLLPSLIRELLSNNTILSESSTLCSVLHSHGLNLRYLGKATELLGSRKPYVRDLMIREMVVRACKHTLHTYMRSLRLGEESKGISHFLNCFIRGAFMRNYNNPNAPAESHIPEQFNITPNQLWESIENHLSKYFNYSLQKDDFVASEYMAPTIRLLCQKTGIKLLSRSYDFYGHQAIQEDDIMGLFPIVKLAEYVSPDGNQFIEAAKKVVMSGVLDQSFRHLTETLSIFHQIYGPMHYLTAYCYKHLAALLSHCGDYAQTLIHQSKAIIILERILGLDNYETAYEYGNLGLFYHQAGHAPLALGFFKRSLYLGTLIGGSKYPNNGGTLSNIAAILQDTKNFEEAIRFYEQALECLEYHFGPKVLAIANTYHNIALCNAHLGEFRTALLNEKKSYEILKDLLGENDSRTRDSGDFMKQYTSKAVETEKTKTIKSKINTNSTDTGKRATDDSIGTLPIRDILKYINNSEPRGRVHSAQSRYKR